MKRKVVKHGPSTLIISLPSKWVKKHNIEKGAELEVSEKDKTLIVSAEVDGKSKPMEVDMDLTGLDRTSIMYTIRSLYRIGYDTINVSFENALTQYQRTGENLNVISVIHTEVNRLVGFEIVQEREKSCVIKDLEIASMKDFDQVMRRIFLLLMDTSSGFLEGAKNNNISLLETIEEKHNTITKFASYCLRLLNKKGYPVSIKTAYYYHIIAALDRVTDIIKYAARDLRSYNKKLNPKVIGILEVVNQDIRTYYELFYKYDKAKIVEINTSRYKAEKALRNLPSSVKAIETIVATSTYQILETLLDLMEARTALEY